MKPAVTLGALAVRYGCDLRGDPDSEVDHVGTLRNAGSGAVAFLANPAYRSQLRTTRATAVVVSPREAAECPVAALVARNPYSVFARLAGELHPAPACRPGVHPAASIGSGAAVPGSCQIDAGVAIGAGARLGERCVVAANVSIGDGVVIGDDARIYSGVVLYPGVRIGARCVIHGGAVIGADGFGFAREADGSSTKVPQIGGVIVGDDVEIGANTTIDRGAIEDTVIGHGVKIDNQVQVGHNVAIGMHTVIAGLCGIAGSTTIGARCMIGGQVGIAGHITIADDVAIGGGTPVRGALKTPGVYAGGGLTADDIRSFRRNITRAGRLEELAGRIAALEKALGIAGSGPRATHRDPAKGED